MDRMSFIPDEVHEWWSASGGILSISNLLDSQNKTRCRIKYPNSFYIDEDGVTHKLSEDRTDPLRYLADCILVLESEVIGDYGSYLYPLQIVRDQTSCPFHLAMLLAASMGDFITDASVSSEMYTRYPDLLLRQYDLNQLEREAIARLIQADGEKNKILHINIYLSACQMATEDLSSDSRVIDSSWFRLVLV